MKRAESLLPCPFCGSEDIDPSFWASLKEHGPGCMNCGANVNDNAAWNTRADSYRAGLQAAIGKVREKIEAERERRVGLLPVLTMLEDLLSELGEMAGEK